MIKNNVVEDAMNNMKITFKLGKNKSITMGGLNSWNGGLEIKLASETHTKPYVYHLNITDIDLLIRVLLLINSVNTGKN